MNRTMVLIGVVIVLIGLLWPWLAKLHLGHLPGDIVINRPSFKLYIPITSMVLISVVVSIILGLFRK